MKKAISIFLIVLCLFSLCSCAQSSSLIQLAEIIGFERKVSWGSVSTEKSQLGSAYKNHFARLDDNQKKAYNNILENLYGAEEAFPEKIEIPVMDGDSLTKIFEAIIYDNPDIFYLDKSCSLLTEGAFCYFKPDYIMTLAQYKAKLTELNQKVDSILSALSPDDSDFEKELYIHDFIAENCKYDAETQFSGTIFSCILDGVAACEGYSKAAKYILEAAGIENYTVVGMAKNSLGQAESHMWNIVNINDNFYYLDVTWDDPEGSESGVSHIYMNLNSKEIMTDHYDFIEDFECTETDENYFIKSDSMFYSYKYSDYKKIRDLLGENAKNGINRIELRFNSEKPYKNAIYELAKQGKAYDLATSVNRKYSVKLNTDNISYTQDDRFFVIELIF